MMIRAVTEDIGKGLVSHHAVYATATGIAYELIDGAGRR
jgi:hypothetical protein